MMGRDFSGEVEPEPEPGAGEGGNETQTRGLAGAAEADTAFFD